MLDEFGRQGSLATADPALAAARGATAATGRLRDQLDPFQSGYSTPGGVTYPPNNSFARRLNVWSEFGRRPGENGSGTDHGAAGASFVIGSRARGQMVGRVSRVDHAGSQNNLRHTSDFRALYCSLLEQWFEVDAASVVPGAAGFSRPQLLD